MRVGNGYVSLGIAGWIVLGAIILPIAAIAAIVKAIAKVNSRTRTVDYAARAAEYARLEEWRNRPMERYGFDSFSENLRRWK